MPVTRPGRLAADALHVRVGERSKRCKQDQAEGHGRQRAGTALSDGRIRLAARRGAGAFLGRSLRARGFALAFALRALLTVADVAEVQDRSIALLGCGLQADIGRGAIQDVADLAGLRNRRRGKGEPLSRPCQGAGSIRLASAVVRVRGIFVLEVTQPLVFQGLRHRVIGLRRIRL